MSWYEWWYGIDPTSEQEKVELTQLEEEINSSTYEMYHYKDSVFAQLSITLKSGTFKLVLNSREIFELEFENTKVEFESRPRTKSYKFLLTLEGLYLRDKISTAASMFPTLISPVNAKSSPLYPASNISGIGAKLSSWMGASMSNYSKNSLFLFQYEINPSPKVDVRIHCQSQSLNIVYNPIVVHSVTDFFATPGQSRLNEKIKAAAFNRIEETKEELKRNLNFDDDFDVSDNKVWDVVFELSAPQILIPESFTDKDSLILVIDFGKFYFANHEKNPAVIKEEKEEDEDEEDEFCTPCSTPDELDAVEATSVTLDSSILHDKIYDRYSLTLSDMQVIVGKIKDNWKYAHLKGTSALHILDKFSIACTLEKRNFNVNDPAWPSIVVSGNLPRLNVHINEEKLFALQRMFSLLRGDYDFKSSFHSIAIQTDLDSIDTDDEPQIDKSYHQHHKPETKETNPNKVILIHFCVKDMAVELQSQGKSITELQVTGVRAALTKRPTDTNISLSVHSLLLVDALQTFGPNFELLVASHRNVSVDSISGSLRGSEPVSPTSPTNSYDVSASPKARDIKRALKNLEKSPPAVQVDISDPDALISIDVLIIDDDEERLQIVNVQFNSLDVIANQETIIELISFMKRVLPATQNPIPRRRVPLKDSGCQTVENIGGSLSNISMMGLDLYSDHQIPPCNNKRKQKTKIELNADFQRLNVLLLRATTGKMIGTALLTEVKVISTICDNFEVSGSLGGLQIMNLLSGSVLHQKIVSVGKDPSITDNEHFRNIHNELYPGFGCENNEAFTFSIHRKDVVLEKVLMSQQNINIKINMASVSYLHSTTFLEELNSCASDFKMYMSNLASTIRNAATEMALGIVNRRTEAMEEFVGLSSHRKSFRQYDSIDRRTKTTPAPAPTPHIQPSNRNLSDFQLTLDVVMETPILVVPRHERSFEVLVAHLGEIAITNEEIELPNGKTDRYNISVKDMNLHSLDLKAKYNSNSENIDDLNLISQFKHLTAQDLYSCQNDVSIPILHDTKLDIVFDIESFIKEEKEEEEEYTSFLIFDDERLSTNYRLSGKVVHPLKITLVRSQYEQILDSLKSKTPSPNTATTFKRINVDVDDYAIESSHNIFASFEIPTLIVELKGDMMNKTPQGLVNVIFQDLNINYDKTQQYKNSFEIILKSLIVDDLLVEEDQHRKLMTSIPEEFIRLSNNELSSSSNLSTSCPELSSTTTNYNNFSRNGKNNSILNSSLPDELNAETIFGMPAANNISVKNIVNNSSVTPPPTIVPSRSSSLELFVKRDNLVHITVLNIDPKSPDYSGKYNSTDRFVDVDFNTLDIIFNLQTWVIVLDFFGIGSGAPPEQQQQQQQQSSQNRPSRIDSLHFNTEIEIKVKSLNVILNKPSLYELAKISVNGYSSTISLRRGNFKIDGKLATFLLKDLSPSGHLYRDRFLTKENHKNVLSFNLFKYGSSDERLERPYDANLTLRMVSVIYVHTHRFYSELVAFFTQFNNLQSVMSRVRNAAAGSKIQNQANRGIRVRLDIEAKSPILFLPMSSNLTQIITVDLGNLSIKNNFSFAGEAGTISSEKLTDGVQLLRSGRRSRATSVSSRRSRNPSCSTRSSRCSSRPRHKRGPPGTSEDDEKIVVNHRCLLDILDVSLTSMDLRMGDRVSAFIDDKLTDDISVGGFIVRLDPRQLLHEKCELKLRIERNLDKAFCHKVPDLSVEGVLSKVHAKINEEHYKIIRGFLAFNLGEPIDELDVPPVPTSEYVDPETQTILTGNTWTGMFINIELQDVILDCIEESKDLARISLFKSRLIYESFSDGSRDVDLVSTEISLTDRRYINEPRNKQNNVFTQILKPMTNDDNEGGLQAEVHYRQTAETNRFTILLNNMKLIGILDWWNSLLKFVSLMPENPLTVGITKLESTETMKHFNKLIAMEGEPL